MTDIDKPFADDDAIGLEICETCNQTYPGDAYCKDCDQLLSVERIPDRLIDSLDHNIRALDQFELSHTEALLHEVNGTLKAIITISGDWGERLRPAAITRIRDLQKRIERLLR